MSTLPVSVVDTHTAGEPTRVVVAGGPDLVAGSLAERCARLRVEHDVFRSAVVNEPRGSDVLVGALLVPPADATCAAGVIFFNNVGVLGMCGHGTMGVVVALRHLGRCSAGVVRLETPVGVVACEYDGANNVAVTNVPSYRHRSGVTVEVPQVGQVTGDVAWGGNWFFLASAEQHDLTLGNVAALSDQGWRIRRALAAGGVTGAGGAEIDHIELFGPAADPRNQARNFVLCPGGAYDRSPCGTGTSAKLACLAADGKLAPGDCWRQESIIGSVFTGWYRRDGDHIIPRIEGSAFVTAEATLLFHPADPFRHGIRP